MKVVLCLAFMCIMGTLAIKENYLKYNKTPKEALSFVNVCEECEDIVKRFADAVKNPAKLATLKELLLMMCDETKHPTECRIIVSKLDLFIHELLPYLKNTNKICHRFHMCNNPKIDQFHRVGLLYVKKFLADVDGSSDLICEECQFAAHELQQVTDNIKTQNDIRRFLSTKVCARLRQYRGSCDIVLEDFLPELFQELHSLLQDSKQFCVDLKLCTRQQVGINYQSQTENVKVSKHIISDMLV